MKGSRLITLLVLTVACVAAVELGYQLLENLVLVPDGREQVVATPEVSPKPAVVSPEASAAAILKRNLFAASIQPQVVPSDDMRPSELKLILLGTVKSDAGEHRAIILDEQNFSQDLYPIGATIKGAEIVEIHRGKVVLLRGGTREVLDISKAAALNPKDDNTAGPSEAPGKTALPVEPLVGIAAGAVTVSDQQAEVPVSTGARQRMRSRIVRPVSSSPAGQ